MARRAPEKPRPAAVDQDDRPGHTHQLPRPLLLTLIIICAGLAVSILLVSALAVQANHQADDTNRRLTALEEFIDQRGEMRDQQYRTLDERITRKLCAALEALPAGGLLDGVRAENGCGPGVPLDQLSPAAQEQLQQFSNGLDVQKPDPPEAVRPRKTDDQRIPATAEPNRKAPRTTPAETTDAPSPTPTAPVATAAPVAPPVAPDQSTAAPAAPTPPTRLTDRLCDAIGLCIGDPRD